MPFWGLRPALKACPAPAARPLLPPPGFAGACVLEYLWGGEAPLVHLGLVQPATPLAQAPW